MATKINYLSIDFTIGGNQILLETTKVPSKDEIDYNDVSVGASLKKLLMEQSFELEKGKVITVKVEDFITAIGNKMGAAFGKEVSDFFQKVAKKTTGISIDLWDLRIVTSILPVGTMLPDPNDNTNTNKIATIVEKGYLTFGFKVRVNLDQSFYDSIGIPKDITTLISIQSLGLGIVYDKVIEMTPDSKKPSK